MPPAAADNVKHGHIRTGSDHYYEDVDPRFANDGPLPSHDAPPSPVPNSLTPGPQNQRYPSPAVNAPPPHSGTPNGQPNGTANNRYPDPSFEDSAIPDGARSPTESEASNFTSVSQRGVNPHWRPPPGPTLQPPPRKMMAQRREDLVLGANPDFALPGVQPTRNVRSRSGSRGGPNGSQGRITPAAMLPDGRYPTAL